MTVLSLSFSAFRHLWRSREWGGGGKRRADPPPPPSTFASPLDARIAGDETREGSGTARRRFARSRGVAGGSRQPIEKKKKKKPGVPCVVERAKRRTREIPSFAIDRPCRPSMTLTLCWRDADRKGESSSGKKGGWEGVLVGEREREQRVPEEERVESESRLVRTDELDFVPEFFSLSIFPSRRAARRNRSLSLSPPLPFDWAFVQPLPVPLFAFPPCGSQETTEELRLGVAATRTSSDRSENAAAAKEEPKSNVGNGGAAAGSVVVVDLLGPFLPLPPRPPPPPPPPLFDGRQRPQGAPGREAALASRGPGRDRLVGRRGRAPRRRRRRVSLCGSGGRGGEGRSRRSKGRGGSSGGKRRRRATSRARAGPPNLSLRRRGSQQRQSSREAAFGRGASVTLKKERR